MPASARPWDRPGSRETLRMVRPDWRPLPTAAALTRTGPRGLAQFAEAAEAAQAAQAAHFAHFAEAANGTLAVQAAQAARIARAAPHVPRVTLAPVDPRLVLLTEPRSARADAFRILRDNLLDKGLPRVIAVSSVARRDGNTTCAVNLALALAENQRQRVLLLEGNPFAPSLATIFEVDEQAPSLTVALPGVARYGLVELTPRLHVAVPRPDQSALRFDKHAFMALLAHLCSFGYDHVVVDAPAIEVSPNVSRLFTAVDAVLLSLRSGRTTTRALRRAVEAIPLGKALGVALIDG